MEFILAFDTVLPRVQSNRDAISFSSTYLGCLSVRSSLIEHPFTDDSILVHGHRVRSAYHYGSACQVSTLPVPFFLYIGLLHRGKASLPDF
jgi:hypothetical protein